MSNVSEAAYRLSKLALVVSLKAVGSMILFAIAFRLATVAFWMLFR